MAEPFAEIRRLGPEDVRLMRALNSLFADAFAEPETYGAEPPAESYLSGVLAREHVIALVATIADEVVGGLVAYELDKLERQRREVYVYDLAVAASHRRRGLATTLLRQVQKIARDRSAWVVFVQADYADGAAVALYDKLGTREEVLHFDLRGGDTA